MKNSDQPAYPATLGTGGLSKHYDGLTKRECFAAMAMQGYLSILSDSNVKSPPSAAFVAKQSVEFADALLSELEKPQP